MGERLHAWDVTELSTVYSDMYPSTETCCPPSRKKVPSSQYKVELMCKLFSRFSSTNVSVLLNALYLKNLEIKL